MSVFSEHRFKTPTPAESIILDVTELDGIIGGPAQFTGKTPDNRDVYCRLRGGCLRVQVAREPGQEACGDGEYIFNENIGVESLLTRNQLCNLVGITINGELPPFNSYATQNEIEDWGKPRDLSGATTFYRNTIECTGDSQKEFFKLVMESFDPITCVEFSITKKKINPIYRAIVNWGAEVEKYLRWKLQRFNSPRIKSYYFDFETIPHGFKTFDPLPKMFEEGRHSWYFFLDQIPDETLIARGDEKTVGYERLFPEHLVGSVMSGFHDLSGTNEQHDNLLIELSKASGIKVETLFQSTSICTDHLHISIDFLNKNSKYCRLVKKIDNLFDEYFPKYKIESVDLSTGKLIPDKETIEHCDPAVVQWCQQSEGRYMHIYKDYNKEDYSEEGYPHIGIRPSEKI